MSGKNIGLVFRRHWRSYNPGELAGFPEPLAAELQEKGIAETPDAREKRIAAQAAAQKAEQAKAAKAAAAAADKGK